MRALVLVLAMALLDAPLARAARPVDVALVLVTDVSLSITKSEYTLEKEGYANAIESPAVLHAIEQGPLGAIALSYVEFSNPSNVDTIVGWHRITNAASAKRFVAALLAAPRSSVGETAIGSAIATAVGDLAESGFSATRRMIDVCGDGNDNSGLPLRVARDEARHAGITINGLAIIHSNPPPWLAPHVDPPGGLVKYYRDHVAEGPGSFVMRVGDDQDFGKAMTRKLVLEIAGRHEPAFLTKAANRFTILDQHGGEPQRGIP